MGISSYSGVRTAGLVRTGAERATLVRRTYSVVFASIVVTVLGAWVALSSPSIMQAVAAHPFIATILWFAPLLIARSSRLATGQQLGLVQVFAFATGVLISPMLYVYNAQQPGVVGQAAGLTLGAFGILTLYAWTSRRDFSAWGSFFAVGVLVLFGTSLLNLFFHNQTASLWIAAATVLVFSGLLVFDTWRIRNQYGPDEYVGAAVQIYLDLLNMFLAIVQLLGGGRRN